MSHGQDTVTRDLHAISDRWSARLSNLSTALGVQLDARRRRNVQPSVSKLRAKRSRQVCGESVEFPSSKISTNTGNYGGNSGEFDGEWHTAVGCNYISFVSSQTVQMRGKKSTLDRDVSLSIVPAMCFAGQCLLVALLFVDFVLSISPCPQRRPTCFTCTISSYLRFRSIELRIHRCLSTRLSTQRTVSIGRSVNEDFVEFDERDATHVWDLRYVR